MSNRVVGSVIAVLLAMLPGIVGAQTLRSVTAVSDTGKIAVFADGNLRSALGQTTGQTVQSASGSLGVSYQKGQLSAQILVSAVGAADPVRGNFGASILPPAAGGSLSAGLVDIAYGLDTKNAFCMDVGIRAYAGVGSSQWVYGPTTDPTTELKVGVVTGGVGAGVRCTIFSGHVGDPLDKTQSSNSVAAYLDVGPAARGIGGDIASDAFKAVRMTLLGTPHHWKLGMEVGLGVTVNGVKAGLTYYWFDGEIPGLSNGQVVAGFSVQSPLFQGILNK